VAKVSTQRRGSVSGCSACVAIALQKADVRYTIRMSRQKGGGNIVTHLELENLGRAARTKIRYRDRVGKREMEHKGQADFLLLGNRDGSRKALQLIGKYGSRSLTMGGRPR